MNPVDPTSTPCRAWLTPWRCRLLLIVLVGLNFFFSWRYLTIHCPIDLAGDEAQYWDWSRHLDLSYYSKGPMVAYLIRASCALMGETMPAVRLPALVLAMGTSICMYWLSRKMFGSDRLALGTVLMGLIVPLFIAGGVMMTIDPPLMFFWALATCFAAKAIWDDCKWAWLAAGVAAGFGVLTKYAMLLWPPLVILFLLVDPTSRRKLRTVGPWVMTLIAIAFLTPPMIWNAQHDWVSFRHVSAQIGTSAGTEPWKLSSIFTTPIELLASQLMALNPFIAGLTVAAMVYAIRVKRSPSPGTPGEGRGEGDFERITGLDTSNHPHPNPLPEYRERGPADPKRAMRYLMCIGATFVGICVADSFVAKTQANWPAPAYFTLLILTGYFISVQWRQCKVWLISAIVFGAIMQPILHDLTLLYPVVGFVQQKFPHWLNKDGQPKIQAKTLDPEYKMRGLHDQLAPAIAADLAVLPPDSFVMCEAYEDASQLAFYLPGQPKTYFVGSYWTDPTLRRRWTQFDIWPDRNLDRPELKGRDCLYVGKALYAPLKSSFDRMERLPDIVIRVRGMDVTSFEVWKCTGFKGIKRPRGDGPR
jgi:4-amino-4-deoxy-L-arabinose transferase-like glycosyltransferase